MAVPKCAIAHYPDAYISEDCLFPTEGDCPHLESCQEAAEWHRQNEERRAAEENDRRLHPEKYEQRDLDSIPF